MTLIDYFIFGGYFLAVIYVGYYFNKKNKSLSDYYVGSRNISASHIGMSIVATDVGGGFSIGLGGLGFVMGLSGSWLLFTGLIGAWLAAVFVVPHIKKFDAKEDFYTYPDFLKYHYGAKVAILASIISAVGYLGFTGAQILAGAKLASASILSGIDVANKLDIALYVMAAVVIGYTVLGGLKAVIYTDTIQWIILLFGLIFLGLPFAYFGIGGYDAIQTNLPDKFFTLTNVSATQLTNWAFTIIPIWFIAMTLYQRIYACRNEKEAKKAFYVAGFLEYPIMAFVGVALGMLGRIAFPDAEPEMGLPLLLKSALPAAITGIVLAAYFSAIMSTADSCLLASSSNFVNDLLNRYVFKNLSMKGNIRLSQIVTFIIGIIAVLLASNFKTVLELILHAYAFMVAGLFIPTVAAYIFKIGNSKAAIASMLSGGVFTFVTIALSTKLPLGLDPSVYGILISLVVFITVHIIFPQKDESVNVR